MPTQPVLIAGHDLWREIYNDCAKPEELLCRRLGCRMVVVDNEPGDDSPRMMEPSDLTGWWLVSWDEGSNPNRFDELAEYRQVVQERAEVYRGWQLVEQRGAMKLYQGFRCWRIVWGNGQQFSVAVYPTEESARAAFGLRET